VIGSNVLNMVFNSTVFDTVSATIVDTSLTPYISSPRRRIIGNLHQMGPPLDFSVILDCGNQRTLRAFKVTTNV
jgi:hypothetical protein